MDILSTMSYHYRLLQKLVAAAAEDDPHSVCVLLPPFFLDLFSPAARLCSLLTIQSRRKLSFDTFQMRIYMRAATAAVKQKNPYV